MAEDRWQTTDDTLNIKFEIPSTKHETNPNDQNSNDQNGKRLKFVFNFLFGTLENLDFEFVSDFDIRISDF